ncbi:MAG: antirepressor regulating drug resistance protein, partial [Bradyrhizobium sp.]|nr:antirepressor regulating drug resistance protein [Bradyrhizobium sp.]
MMLTILAESALRSLALGSAVWVGLHLRRIRNPHVHMTSWVMVLVASLAMPLLMHWTTVTVILDALPVLPTTEAPWSAAGPLSEPLRSSLPSDPGMPAAGPGTGYAAVNWLAVATAIYGFVTCMLLLRLAVGISLTWRLVRAAKPMSEPWTADWRVRVSNVIAG